jgi:hypothetical protein
MTPSVAPVSEPEAPAYNDKFAKVFVKKLPPASRARLEKAGVDLSHGYPWLPENPPKYLDEVLQIRNGEKYVSPSLTSLDDPN